MLLSIDLADSVTKDDDDDGVESMMKKLQETFGILRDRIERKRQEIQGLRDGVRHPTPNSIFSGCGETC